LPWCASEPVNPGQSGEGGQAIERSSFLKKRSKKLLRPRSGRRRAPNKQKFFGSFFKKELLSSFNRLPWL
jgi:hypothetical protein